ncbi:transcription factor GTE9-like [Cornus florida]|uniref:transcription factor GTE9-like n=1 Tax=Cornus florida TaxID=4283 RepID=UPI0028A1F708|nr:transcription factor GTE9-like [Cornus florida]XP_059641357.1 transcription factor GTE9-like [Cornus florida]XP_059641358.1 transcription factor GTE9-like [Cornus florida]XP_059641359.1 transcription factor GTE9-like [Cornus florida]
MMAKKDRFQEECSTGFAPNYESEGSGSAGPVDMEVTASEDSGALMRKCINLNSATRDGFGVPIHVLPLSKLSPHERKDLVLRLRAELEQIRIFQKRAELQRTNVVTMSSSSDILSCSNTQNGPSVENFRKSLALNSGPGKKLNPPGQKGRGWNRGSSGRFESAKLAAAMSTSNAIFMKQCEALLKKVMSHQYGWAFNTPVDVVKLNIPDYLTVIKHPMDLGTIKSKIASCEYSDPLDFAADVRRTFSNAMTYNPPGNDFHFMADTVRKFFEMRWKVIEKKLRVDDSQQLPESSGLHEAVETFKPVPQSKKRKIASVHHKHMPEPVKRVMTDEEKHNLSRELDLMGDLPDNIVEFLREQSSNGRGTGEDEIEIDIDDLSEDTLFMLRKLLDDYLQEKQDNLAKAEPCEIELLNEPGLSNSSMQLCKGNDHVDEDVDIGGNEPPVSSYPPVEIEKDTDLRSNKCNSSGSFRDNLVSDSGGAESELDGAKAPSPVKQSKESSDTGPDLDDKTGVGDLHDGNQSVSGLDQLEQDPQQNQNFDELDCNRDGESAPIQRQVSPEKLYRAALLKNRFADTILKAREKTLKQGEKGDPEKLRREREELEMQKRKEKARLQAEAKAAEDARRRAEAEAAAVAKRKRELEREAARQALQKMEKTVEINENSRFLEDLQMLSAVPPEQLPSSVDETSPDHSQDGLGSFKFGASNPLEQLGLYMKVDEEEEEGEPPHILSTANDVEEGEID